MIQRRDYLLLVKRCLKENPCCALLGPRQCGKTTLARQFASGAGTAHFFDLESTADQARLSRPELVLSGLTGLVVIDEIQRRPELFTVLRPLIDRRDQPAKFLILGSASPELVKGVSESLAGRIGFVDLSGFNLREVGSRHAPDLWLKGGYPRSFLAASAGASLRWRHNFIRSFLERDIPQLGIRTPAATLHRFCMMLAHYHGQIWNASEIARSLGTSVMTVSHYLDLLTGTFLVRQLKPWFENVSKRQYKSPKIYVRDSGLLNALLDIETMHNLQAHPKFGSSWEGFALEQILAVGQCRQAYFWGTHAGAELDLLLMHRGRRYGIEFKVADAPTMTRSLHIALSDLRLDQAWVVYPGRQSYAVHEQVTVTPLADLLQHLDGI